MKPRSIIRSLSRDKDKVTSLLSKNCLSFFTGVSSQALVITPKFTFYNMAPAIEHALKLFPYKWKWFMWYLLNKGLAEKYKLFVVHNHKETDECIRRIQEL